ncbi:phosphotransferase [Microlunatus sp. GCM10028923]|uniref:phosphotransferase n=1 Tax=Microlunatus sp. GCM10028923 TaxID=3273400 RepID=UPI00360E25AA
MTNLDLLSRRFGITLDPDTVTGGLSGSAVRRATRADGTPVVVKIRFAESGFDRTAAERELAFYRELAGGLAIRTPDLLDHHLSDDCVAILLSAPGTIRPAEDWTHDHWLALAGDLAALHETPVPDGDLWRHGPDGEVPGTDPERWRSYWDRAGEAELFAPIFDDPAVLTAAVREQPPCFGHGDCHTDNILITDAGMVWADWQVTGISRPAGDLAFAAGRAAPSGATPPLPEMIKVYAERRGLDPAAFARSVLAAGLSATLFVWPAYLGYNTPAAVDRVHRRAVELARDWLAQV